MSEPLRHHRNANPQRQQLQIFLGGLVATIRPPLVHLSIRGKPSDRTLRRVGPPRLYRGQRADHLTIPLAPQPHGPHVGKFDLHLTYFDRGHRHHVTVAAVAPAEIEAAVRPVAEELLAHNARSIRRVTVEGLRRDGFLVALPSEEMEQRAAQLLSERRAELRLNQSSFARLGEHIELYDPEVLDALVDEGEYQRVMMISEHDGRAIFVGYHPEFASDRPPGWYATPSADVAATIFERTFMLGRGVGFYDAMLTIARELQMDADIDAIERGRDLALAMLTQREPLDSPP